jgi:hypothetical protein
VAMFGNMGKEMPKHSIHGEGLYMRGDEGHKGVIFRIQTVE